MKKSLILLIAFLTIYFGGSFIHELQLKGTPVTEGDKMDTTNYTLPSFSVVNHRGFWNIKIRQDSVAQARMIMTREIFDSIQVFVCNDTLYIVNHKAPSYLLEFPRKAAIFEITLANTQKHLAINAAPKSLSYYSTNNVRLENLKVTSGSQSEHLVTRLYILNSSIKNLDVSFAFINTFNCLFYSDTIENVSLKLNGIMSGSSISDVYLAEEERAPSRLRNDTCFKNSVISNYALDCFGAGILNLGGHTPGKIIGQIDGAIELKYPAEKDISTLKIKGACDAAALQKSSSGGGLVYHDAKIRITSNPVYLPIYSDSGTCYGRTNEIMHIPTGTHHLRIKYHDNYFDTTLTLKKGTNKGFFVNLRK